MLVVETIAKICRAYFAQNKPIKTICRELRVSRRVVRKVIRSQATEFRYERSRQPLPRIDPWRDQLDGLLLENEGKPARERLTLIRIFEELRALGYEGSYDAVRRYAKRWRAERGAAMAEAYVPLSFAAGEAYQFDWSHEIVLINGVTVTVKVAHVRLCHSRMLFVRAYPRETQEMVFFMRTTGPSPSSKEPARAASTIPAINSAVSSVGVLSIELRVSSSPIWRRAGRRRTGLALRAQAVCPQASNSSSSWHTRKCCGATSRANIRSQASTTLPTARIGTTGPRLELWFGGVRTSAPSCGLLRRATTTRSACRGGGRALRQRAIELRGGVMGGSKPLSTTRRRQGTPREAQRTISRPCPRPVLQPRPSTASWARSRACR